MNDRELLLRMEDALRFGARIRCSLIAGCGDALVAASRMLAECIRGGHKVLLFGNGGSAADAQHISAELVGRFVSERDPLPAIALTVDTSALTAIANDYGFEQVFARQLRAHARPGDVAIALSTSGGSPNVLAAVRVARELGIKVIGLTGARRAALHEEADVCIAIPSTNTARIQELHITVGHLFCELIDAALMPDPAPAPRAPEPLEARSANGKIVDLPTLLHLRAHWRRQNMRLAWTNGVFDVIHFGHIETLRAARAHGDVLVVGVNADEAVRALKGPERPVFPVAQRAALLAAMEDVDHVLVFSETTPEAVLAQLQPEVHCKGADYAPPHGAPIPEARVVESYGGRMAFLPLVAGLSTTGVIGRLRAPR